MEFKTKEEMHKERTVYAVDKVSKSYAPVSTEVLLMPFLNNGWYIYKQVGKGLGKQLTTLRHLDYIYPNGDFLTVEALNSFDGSSALVLMGGYGRIACSNGLIIGDIEGGRFIHSGTAIYEKLENQYEKIIAHLDKIKANVETLKSAELGGKAIYDIMHDIARNTFEKDTKSTTVKLLGIPNRVLSALVKVQRVEDFGDDAFTVMNRVQEAIIRDGRLAVKISETDKSTGKTTTRFTSKKATENKITSVKLNKIITEAFLKGVA